MCICACVCVCVCVRVFTPCVFAAESILHSPAGNIATHSSYATGAHLRESDLYVHAPTDSSYAKGVVTSPA